jgi:hypothetical protein
MNFGVLKHSKLIRPAWFGDQVGMPCVTWGAATWEGRSRLDPGIWVPDNQGGSSSFYPSIDCPPWYTASSLPPSPLPQGGHYLEVRCKPNLCPSCRRASAVCSIYVGDLMQLWLRWVSFFYHTFRTSLIIWHNKMAKNHLLVPSVPAFSLVMIVLK